MENFKEFLAKHFEKLLVLTILIAAIVGNYLIEEKFILLNFYYLPVLTAGYFLGRRLSLLTALFCILAVGFLVALDPAAFSTGLSETYAFSLVAAWGGFLVLASAAVGTLYEQNQERVEDLKRAYVGVLEILAKYLEDTDRYTKGHSVRVAELAMDIGIAMELPRETVENIRVGGLLHDIGKIEISGDLIRKAASLNDTEKATLDTHAERGAKILRSVGNVLKGAIPIVMASHKYFSGSQEGHEELPIGARIIAVADAFDAMTSDRPYRQGMSPWKAYDELKEGAGSHFDPDVVEAFGRVLEMKLERV